MNTARLLWSISAVLLLAALVWLCATFGWSAAGMAVLFALLPDAALIGAFASHGRLKPSRVRFYNLMHAPAPALVLTVAGLALLALLPIRPWALAIAGLAWLVHIAVDRALGYGLRAPDGSIIPVGEANPPGKQA